MKAKHLFYTLLLLAFSIEVYADNRQKTPFSVSSEHTGFIENKGQVLDENGKPAADVLFTFRQGEMDIHITTTGISYVFWEQTTPEFTATSKINSAQVLATGFNRTDILLKDANIQMENIKTSGTINQPITKYYNAVYPKGITDVKSFEKIEIADVYPGIDWVFYTEEDADFAIKYDFVVKPGANPSDIRMLYQGAALSLDKNSLELNLVTDFGSLREGALYSYQEAKGNQVTSFYVLDNNEVSFEVEGYNTQKELVIDPPVLVWSTNYGGTASDYAIDTVVDEADNLYIYGKTRSTTLPGIIGNGTNMGRYDLFVVKFDTHGALQWSAMFGGTGNDDSDGAIVVNSAGDEIYFVGTVPSLDYPILELPGAYNQATFEGGNSGFISKLDNEGTLLWSTFIGGEKYDYLRDVVLDENNQMFIMGFTSSSEFPVLEKSGAYNQPMSDLGLNEGVLLQFDENRQLVWSTYFGGDGTDQMSAMKIAPNGNLFIVGSTDSRDFPLVEKAGAYNSDVFDITDETQVVIMEFDPNGALIWSTLFGGGNYEQARNLQWDAEENLYVIGETESPDLPVMELPGAYFSGELNNQVAFYLTDAFIARFDTAGALDWSTYYGGDKADLATAIEFDEQGNMWLGGATASEDFPILELEDAFNQTTILPGIRAMFWAVFDTQKELQWSTYYGSDDFGWNSGFQKRSNSRMLMFTQASSNQGMPTGLVAEDPLAYTQGDVTSNDVVILEFITDDFTLGIQNPLINRSVVVYPNPSKGKVFVKSTQPIEKITVYNLNGQIMGVFTEMTKTGEIDLRDYASGLYVMQIRTTTGVESKKVLIAD